MEKFVCFVLCLAAFVSAGSALKCYSCDSDKLDGCIKSSNPKDVVCGPPATTAFQSVCSYKVTHDTAKKTDKVRSSCEQIATGAPLSPDSLADCKPIAGMEVKECRLCATDLCNSSSAISVNMISFLCLPLMYLVSKFVLS